MSWVRYAPSLVAGIALAVSLIFVSTLSTLPQVQIQRGSDQTLVSSTDRYEKEAQKILARSITNRSKLLINTNKVADELHKAFPELGDMTVIIPLIDRRLIVQAQPVPPAVVLSVPRNGAFVVDAKGRVIAHARDVDSSVRDSLPQVRDESGLEVEVGRAALPESDISFIREVYGQLAAKQVVVDAFVLPTASKELHLQVKGKPYYVKFDMQGEGRQQAGTYLAVKDKLEKDGVTPAEYIDVRVSEKTFYK